MNLRYMKGCTLNYTLECSHTMNLIIVRWFALCLSTYQISTSVCLWKNVEIFLWTDKTVTIANMTHYFYYYTAGRLETLVTSSSTQSFCNHRPNCEPFCHSFNSFNENEDNNRIVSIIVEIVPFGQLSSHLARWQCLMDNKWRSSYTIYRKKSIINYYAMANTNNLTAP